MESSSLNVGEQAIQSAPVEKIDPKSPLWKYVTVVEKIQGGGSLIMDLQWMSKGIHGILHPGESTFAWDKEQWYLSMH